jgi:type IV secretory pathway VirB10-like protein
VAKFVVLKKFTRAAMKQIRFKHILTVAALSVLCTSPAYAQFIWVDEKGVRQYSDMPPPPSIPKKRILKEPGSPSPSLSAAPTEPAAEGTQPTAAAKDKDKGPMTIAEKNADFQKRRAEQAEKEKKAAEEAQRAADKARNCDQARAYHRALQSGDRIARTDKNGERYFLSDEQRAKETQDAKRVLDGCN